MRQIDIPLKAHNHKSPPEIISALYVIQQSIAVCTSSLYIIVGFLANRIRYLETHLQDITSYWLLLVSTTQDQMCFNQSWTYFLWNFILANRMYFQTLMKCVPPFNCYRYPWRNPVPIRVPWKQRSLPKGCRQLHPTLTLIKAKRGWVWRPSLVLSLVSLSSFFSLYSS